MKKSRLKATAVVTADEIGRLVERAEKIEVDDLSGLAQMHAACEAVLKKRSEEPEELISQSDKVRRDLESLILGEAQDAAATLECVRAGIDALARLSRGASAAAASTSPDSMIEPSEEPAADAPAESADIADAMARIFEAPAPESAARPPDVEDPAGSPALADIVMPEAPEPPAEAYEQTPLLISSKELEFVKGFVEEAWEHIESIEAAVLDVERTPENADKINDLFRPFHTIKGMAGFLNLRDINCLTHEIETIMDQARKGQRRVTAGLIDLVFDVVDVLKAQIGAIGNYLGSPSEDPVPQPSIQEMMSRLRAIVAGRIEPQPRGQTPAAANARIGEVLIEQTAVAQEVVDFAVSQQARGDAKPTGEILVEMGVTTPRQVDQAIRTQKANASGAGDQSVRIDTAKLDTLVDMVGELMIAQTQVSATDLVQSDARLVKNVGQVSKIVRTVQEVVLAMRMIPIGSTFAKMARLVRDVSRKAGKQVELSISGEDTELDKNVIQQISDPLVHMVRNAVDHGVESPEERAAAGKPAVGCVHLGACHEGGNIVITIRDDGKGLDPQKLIAKAIEKGLVAPGAELTDAQAFALVFAPGFSTADKITDISGRGVGMDVVKRNIDQLRGHVDIQSEKGKGTTFTIRLPLTLAIIDGMSVRVGGERFIIPTIALEQALRPTRQQITTVQHRGEVVQVRGQLIPLIQLGQVFGLSGHVDPCEAMVVIAQADGQLVGLVVDELIGQQQVVIKTLGERFERLAGISGAAILGDGRVGLILEVAGVIARNKGFRAAGAHDRVGARRNLFGKSGADAETAAPDSGITAEIAAGAGS